ncbi:hypothetical protein [Mesorhizobium sp. M00.F.Ca.ET.217.01.1.1]|uniref:hypothetical protein n=1 Tax=Mesorhizobium sp. M00.F.Ca.ET.217.01.1.1 TaxID=2500529 RepID=UPI000FD892B6|nr:hypothetical protein [Mesorhizobium sp. M00.F.Ca.ET.217.01.1.1]TGQ11376.1 hypothetical protein EN860_032265 [Mesorhizobium sp. M00.F.Ca.ET.217.01.1.1]TGV83814.1 hypothetical protein EN801_031755 [Mesorhizobium sp. M00.F.Ca.ET.158.01.1.1]
MEQQKRMSEFYEQVQWWVAAWHGVSVPNEQSMSMATDLADLISMVERQRGSLHFEDEPASFVAALHAAKKPSSHRRRQ